MRLSFFQSLAKLSESFRYLRKVENYLVFLAERRKLLVEAANGFLKKLANGHVPDRIDIDKTDFIGRAAEHVPGSIDSNEEEARLRRCNNWVVSNGLPEGKLEYELADEQGRQVTILDLAWSNGVQPGLTQPVSVLIGEGDGVENPASLVGFRSFSSPRTFPEYDSEEVLYQESETAHRSRDSRIIYDSIPRLSAKPTRRPDPFGPVCALLPKNRQPGPRIRICACNLANVQSCLVHQSAKGKLGRFLTRKCDPSWMHLGCIAFRFPRNNEE